MVYDTLTGLVIGRLVGLGTPAEEEKPPRGLLASNRLSWSSSHGGVMVPE